MQSYDAMKNAKKLGVREKVNRLDPDLGFMHADRRSPGSLPEAARTAAGVVGEDVGVKEEAGRSLEEAGRGGAGRHRSCGSVGRRSSAKAARRAAADDVEAEWGGAAKGRRGGAAAGTNGLRGPALGRAGRRGGGQQRTMWRPPTGARRRHGSSGE